MVGFPKSCMCHTDIHMERRQMGIGTYGGKSVDPHPPYQNIYKSSGVPPSCIYPYDSEDV